MAVDAKKSGSGWLFNFAPSPTLFFGLMCLFLGRLPFANVDAAKTILSLIGFAAVGVATALRLISFAKHDGTRRALERIFLLCHAGVILALVIHLMGSGAAEDKARTMSLVAWVIIMAASLLPLVIVEFSVGLSGRHSYSVDQSGGSHVEVHRVRESAVSGLSIALAAAFLMVTCNVASERNIRKDVSYFKTSSPGTATVNILKTLDEPIDVALFFPDRNEVAEEVKTYFEALTQDTDRVRVERFNRLTDLEKAEEFQATQDGTVVMTLGKNRERFTVNTDIKQARRTQLRELDKSVHRTLMKVVRERKVVYLTVGHGELNQTGAEREDVTGIPRAGATKASHIRQKLRELNYEVKEYKGLGAPIPDDATIVLSLGPVIPFTSSEEAAIDEYLARGGAFLLALDPTGEAVIGEKLQQRLGLRFDPTPLANDKQFDPRIIRGPAAHQFMLTDEFSSHASTSQASQLGTRLGILLFRAGSLIDLPEVTTTKRTYVIKSTSASFRDANRNWVHDGGEEKRQKYNIAAAIETPTTEGDAAEASKEKQMRAIVTADAEIFADVNMRPDIRLGDKYPPRAIVIDFIRWLGGEEAYAGVINNEKDVFIKHTKSEDVVWFYLTILGAPVLVLTLGLAYVYGRRRRKRRAA